jgi:hypothetical protein
MRPSPCVAAEEEEDEEEDDEAKEEKLESVRSVPMARPVFSDHVPNTPEDDDDDDDDDKDEDDDDDEKGEAEKGEAEEEDEEDDEEEAAATTSSASVGDEARSRISGCSRSVPISKTTRCELTSHSCAREWNAGKKTQ